MMDTTWQWQKEAGPRLQGSRDLDSSKLLAPCAVPLSSGAYRLFYTGLGPARPFQTCQGYILSAISEDGLNFDPEPGIRLSPLPSLPHMSHRVLASTLVQCGDGHWRMYFESRGTPDQPSVICSALSVDMLHWELEEGIRLRGPGNLGGPRYLPLPGGGGRLYCWSAEFDQGGPGRGRRLFQRVVSAATSDGLDFEFDPGFRLRDREAEYDTAGITAAEVVPPSGGGSWTMFFSAWQDVPEGTVVPVHPSQDSSAGESLSAEDFAAASIASDLAGYRSRIFVARSANGLEWERGGCVIEGGGHGQGEIDAVHAEDMSLVQIDAGRYRMYYAACDKDGNWRIASAVAREAAASSGSTPAAN